MPTPGLTPDEIRRRTEAVEQALREGYSPIGVHGPKGSSLQEASIRLGDVKAQTLATHIRNGTLKPDWSLWNRGGPSQSRERPGYTPPPNSPPADLDGPILAKLRKAPGTIEEIAAACAVTPGQALDALLSLQSTGHNIHKLGERYSLEKTPAPADSRQIPEYVSRPDGTYCFGFTSDNHLGSKYSRLDVLNHLYDNFAKRGVDRVFNAGNWIDGEARFNKHDLLVHGMDAQCRYLAEHYPSRPGITTYAVAGDDHEGWYCQREGVDIGRYAERVMRGAGRTDWVDLGYMEAYVRLRHAKTGASSMLHVIHPGGGSAYALSYTTQKIAESYDGGDKPAVALVGHYHKLIYHLSRNVHMIQTGTTEDQTPFMRKKKLAAHVGGGICRLEQDERTGAITECDVSFKNFFVRDYYNNRWNMAADVELADRGV